jgi:hypothetical protein
MSLHAISGHVQPSAPYTAPRRLTGTERRKWESGLLATPGVKGSRADVLRALLDGFAWGRPECWPSNETIAERSQWSVRTVSRCLPRLVELGVIAIEHPRDRQRRITFPTYPPAELAGAPSQIDPAPSQIDPAPSQIGPRILETEPPNETTTTTAVVAVASSSSSTSPPIEEGPPPAAEIPAELVRQAAEAIPAAGPGWLRWLLASCGEYGLDLALLVIAWVKVRRPRQPLRYAAVALCGWLGKLRQGMLTLDDVRAEVTPAGASQGSPRPFDPATCLARLECEGWTVVPCGEDQVKRVGMADRPAVEWKRVPADLRQSYESHRAEVKAYVLKLSG